MTNDEELTMDNAKEVKKEKKEGKTQAKPESGAPSEKPEASEEKKEEKAPKEEAEEDVSEEEAEKLPFPMAAVVRLMKANLDNEKMIKKEVKLAMNKWLGGLCERVSREMNRFPYVTMHLNEFNEAKRVYESLEDFAKEKDRILSHLDAIKKDVERLERDLGKREEEEEVQ